MTDKTNAELIAEAKSRAQLCDADTREVMRDTGNIVARLAAALEAAERERDRLDEAFDRDLPWRYDEVEAQRNQLAAVVEKVRAWTDRNKGTGYGTGTGASALEILDILATAPADALREVKAAAWDEGADDIAEYIENGGERELPNPYRQRREETKQ